MENTKCNIEFKNPVPAPLASLHFRKYFKGEFAISWTFWEPQFNVAFCIKPLPTGYFLKKRRSEFGHESGQESGRKQFPTHLASLHFRQCFKGDFAILGFPNSANPCSAIVKRRSESGLRNLHFLIFRIVDPPASLHIRQYFKGDWCDFVDFLGTAWEPPTWQIFPPL